MNKQATQFIQTNDQWQEEMELLREVLLSTSLDEDFKWKKPCYTYDGQNIVILQGFKNYCALLFFKGVLMKDPNGILVKTGPNTHVGRQIRFTNAKDVRQLKTVIPEYIQDAIKVERSGMKVEAPKKSSQEMPTELRQRLKEDSVFRVAFEKLTPGRQRAYIFYFSSAKQSGTRKSRIEKSLPKILQGKGPNER